MDPIDPLDVARKQTGNHWLDFIVAASAIMIALISLGVSLRQNQLMDKQLAASVWPHLQYGTSNETDDGKPAIRFFIENAGVGPAVVHSMAVNYKGKPVRGVREFIDACCKDLIESAGHTGFNTSTVRDRVLIAGHREELIELPNSPTSQPYWERLNVERQKVEIRVCYCSVLGQCWMMDSTRTDDQPVAACPAAQDSDYQD